MLETNSSHQAEDFKKLLESRREIAIGNRLIQLKAGLGINITVIHKETGAAAGTKQAKLPTSTDLTAPGLPSSSSPVNSAPISQAGPHFPLAKLPHVARIPGEAL